MSWARFVDLVRLEQTLFALPFAYVGMLLAGDGLPAGGTLLWVTAAMVGARTAGMALNRLIDREIDAANPRTRDRALPAGRIPQASVRRLAAGSLALLVLAAANLNTLCLALSPVAVGLLAGYSYLKRYTWACHLGLGLVQACAPIGGWLAVSGAFSLPPLLLGAAIFLWVAGFDVVYACQDVDVDRAQGLHSIPARLGASRAFAVSRAFHVAAVLCLAAAGSALGLGTAYFAAVGAVAAILVWEHTLVTPEDLSRLPQAFFTCNALVSATLLAGALVEVL